MHPRICITDVLAWLALSSNVMLLPTSVEVILLFCLAGCRSHFVNSGRLGGVIADAKLQHQRPGQLNQQRAEAFQEGEKGFKLFYSRNKVLASNLTAFDRM